MAGFLDRQERIVDMVLTDEGKRLLSLGKLRFSSYAFYDDEVDYAPYLVNSSSLSPLELSGTIISKIESCPVLEAMVGMPLSRDVDGVDTLSVNRPLFTSAETIGFVPRTSLFESAETGSILVDQTLLEARSVRFDSKGRVVESSRAVSLGFDRKGSVELTLHPVPDLPPDEGFVVRFYRVGPDGLVLSYPRRDELDRLCLDSTVLVEADEG